MELNKEEKKLLFEVMKYFADNKQDDMQSYLDENDYYDASNVCEDLVQIYSVMNELHNDTNALSCLDSFNAWILVKDWFTEYEDWKDAINRIGNENDLQSFVDSVIKLFVG